MAILCVCLVAVCWHDYRRGKIPNGILLWTLAAGCVWKVGIEGLGGLCSGLLQGSFLMATFYPLFRIGAIGAGDVKLFGVCGVYLSFEKILLFLFFSLLFSAMVSIFQFCKEQNAKERLVYLCQYISAVLTSGHWRRYLGGMEDRKRAGVCMSGPVLCSLLLYWGGVY